MPKIARQHAHPAGQQLVGQSGHRALPVPATAMLRAAAANTMDPVRGCFEHRRTGPLCPLQAHGFAIAQCCSFPLLEQSPRLGSFFGLQLALMRRSWTTRAAVVQAAIAFDHDR